MTDRIDFDQVREVIRIATESDIAELEVETPSLKIRVRKGGPVSVDVPAYAGNTALSHAGGAAISSGSATPGAASAGTHAIAGAPAGQAAGDDHLMPIIAPMVGTFYRAASPEAPPFIKEGDAVDEGQVVCIIEAMKLFNEIQAEVRGRIARVLVDNASPVEYGQPLFLVDTAAGRA